MRLDVFSRDEGYIRLTCVVIVTSVVTSVTVVANIGILALRCRHGRGDGYKLSLDLGQLESEHYLYHSVSIIAWHVRHNSGY